MENALDYVDSFGSSLWNGRRLVLIQLKNHFVQQNCKFESIGEGEYINTAALSTQDCNYIT